MTNFAETFAAPGRMPGFWSGPMGTAFRYALGGTLDQFVQLHWERLRAAWPSFATAASLGEIARDRRILLFENESRASKEARTTAWRSAHRAAGTPAAVLRQGQPLWLPEVPTVRVVSGNSSRALWATVYGTDTPAILAGVEPGTIAFARRVPSNWDWDSAFPFTPEPATVHRHHVIVYAPASVLPAGPDDPIDPLLCMGSTLPLQAGRNVADCARYWSSANAILWGWILAFDPVSFSPTGNSGSTPGGYPDGTWYQSYIPGVGFNRLQTARYHEEHSPIGY